jgi:hypothetical protein
MLVPPQDVQFTKSYVIGCYRVEGLLMSRALKDLIAHIPLAKRYGQNSYLCVLDSKLLGT